MALCVFDARRLLLTLAFFISVAAWGTTIPSTPIWYSEVTYYTSFEAAAAGGVAAYCKLPANQIFQSCTYGGTSPSTDLSVFGYGIVIVVYGGKTYILNIPVGLKYTCPADYQLVRLDAVGPVPVCWVPDPPPPPPPPPKKVIVIDPGHGLTCPSIGQTVGAVGLTDFPPNDPPPGRLREDDLTVAIALETERMLSASYRVVLTKRDVNFCPSFKERGRIANNANAKVFVSIHINKSNTILGIDNPFGNGTSVLYNSSKIGSKDLADQMSGAVSSNLGVNNRGSGARDDLAVLKPSVTNMTAVLVEAARLSGTDERILHAAGSATKVASGVKTALEAFVGK